MIRTVGHQEQLLIPADQLMEVLPDIRVLVNILSDIL